MMILNIVRNCIRNGLVLH